MVMKYNSDQYETWMRLQNDLGILRLEILETTEKNSDFFLLFRFCAIFCVLADFHTFSREVQTLLEARLICMVCLSQLKR